MNDEPPVLIALDRDEKHAPGCFILCRVKNPDATPGHYDWDEYDERNALLVDRDWDFPALARTFGWDGEDRDVGGARELLYRCVEEARVALDDRGYFEKKE